VLGAGPGDPDNINLLKGVIADQRGRNLAGEYHYWNGIAVGRGNTGNRVGGSRAGGHQGNAYIADDPGIGISGMNRGLFMTNENMGNIFIPEEFIIDVNYRSAGETEDNFNVLFLKTFHQCLCACHFHGCSSCKL